MIRWMKRIRVNMLIITFPVCLNSLCQFVWNIKVTIHSKNCTFLPPQTFSLFVVTTTFLLTLLYRVPSSLGDEQLSSNRIGSQKNKVVLNEMTDVKEWKRLIKSKTNVLICFGSGRASFARDDILGVLKEAAGVVKGLGTIALVDCASSGQVSISFLLAAYVTINICSIWWWW